MNINDSIKELLDRGVMSVTIGLTPEQKLFAQATQAVYTGEEGNQMAIQHQAACETIPECLNQIRKQVDLAASIAVERSKIVRLKRN